MPGHQGSQTSRSFSWFRGGPCLSPTWVGLLLLSLGHLPRPGYEQPPYSHSLSQLQTGIPEAVQRVGTSVSRPTARPRGSLKHPRGTQSAPAPRVYPHRRCGPAIRPSPPRAGLGDGVRASKYPEPVSKQIRPWGAERAQQKFTERTIRVLSPKPEQWGKGQREQPRLTAGGPAWVPQVTGLGPPPAGPP